MPDTGEIIALRPSKNHLDESIPYAFIHENEPDSKGNLQGINTVFLTNKECPFHCLMCDLWKNTLDVPTPEGAILRQLDYALERLPPAPVIKLYNSGNFFDQKAISPKEYKAIAERLKGYRRVIVENHPRLCGEYCLTFNDLLEGRLEIALGLETIHPEVWPRLNKQMTPDDYRKAVRFLTTHGIAARTFILLNPPFLTDTKENMDWALNSIRFAFDAGSYCCAIIPTRTGNGIMEKLQEQGHYVPPTLEALETVFDRALALDKGMILVDLWDLERFSECALCFEARKKRMQIMNLNQRILPRVTCTCNG